jgi:hypothetical protein
MSRASILMLLGILVILVPFSGLPTANRSLLEAVFGACVLAFGVSLRARDVRKAQMRVESLQQDTAEAATENTQETSPL